MSKENNGWISAKTQPVPYDGYFLACTYKKDIKILFRTSEYECLVKDNSFYSRCERYYPLATTPRTTKGKITWAMLAKISEHIELGDEKRKNLMLNN